MYIGSINLYYCLFYQQQLFFNMNEEKEKPALPKKEADLPKTAQKGGTRGGKTSTNESENAER